MRASLLLSPTNTADHTSYHTASSDPHTTHRNEKNLQEHLVTPKTHHFVLPYNTQENTPSRTIFKRSFSRQRAESANAEQRPVYGNISTRSSQDRDAYGKVSTRSSQNRHAYGEIPTRSPQSRHAHGNILKRS